MDEILLMRGLQAGGDAAHQRQHLRRRQRAAVHNVGERLALDELHGEIVPAELRLQREAEIAHDRFVMNAAQRQRLIAEHGQHGLVAGELIANELYGDRVAGLYLMAAIDIAHAARLQKGVDLVIGVEPRAGRQGAVDRLDIRRVRHFIALKFRFSHDMNDRWSA